MMVMMDEVDDALYKIYDLSVIIHILPSIHPLILLPIIILPSLYALVKREYQPTSIFPYSRCVTEVFFYYFIFSRHGVNVDMGGYQQWVIVTSFILCITCGLTVASGNECLA